MFLTATHDIHACTVCGASFAFYFYPGPEQIQACDMSTNKQTNKNSVAKLTIPTEQLPFVDEISCQLLWIEGCRMVSTADPLQLLISVF
jgi:hypothetical protein